MNKETASGLSRISAVLIIMTIVAGFAHHTDHVLRVDHSGWPFRPDVNPFTYSLMLYPIFFFALLGSVRLFWVRWSLLLIGTAFTVFAHTVIESPQMQYSMWAHNLSSDPHYKGMHNLLDAQSTPMAYIAVGLAMTVNALLVSSTISMLVDGVRANRSR